MIAWLATFINETRKLITFFTEESFGFSREPFQFISKRLYGCVVFQLRNGFRYPYL